MTTALPSLNGKTVFITGASRGIGREIALRCARDGANIIIAAKSDQPHPKLPGTIHSVAAEVEAVGGRALACQVDVRDELSIAAAMQLGAERFGGIDVLINNASAIALSNVQNTALKRFDLIQSINTRGVLACSQLAIPYLKASSNPHIVTLAPPINLKPKWLGGYIPYTVSKYSMTLLTLGLAEELREFGIAANTLWPRTTIATAAVEFAIDAQLLAASRTPAIMADAAHAIITTPASQLSGLSLIDESILRDRGQTEFEQYKNDPDCSRLEIDLYVDE